MYIQWYFNSFSVFGLNGENYDLYLVYKLMIGLDFFWGKTYMWENDVDWSTTAPSEPARRDLPRVTCANHSSTRRWRTFGRVSQPVSGPKSRTALLSLILLSVFVDVSWCFLIILIILIILFTCSLACQVVWHAFHSLALKLTISSLLLATAHPPS